MASTTKRKQDEPETEAKRAKLCTESDSSKPKATSQQRVVLNPADCNLDFIIEEDGLKGSALYEQGFAYCWSGARANVGITGGRYFFGCKILAAQPVDMEDTPPDQQHICRFGISRGDDPLGNLGETQNSFGFGGTGKFSNAGKFADYGEKFGVGDTVVCAVDLESRPWASIGFYKNGKWLGKAKLFDAGQKGLGVIDSSVRERQWESAVFPHVLLKNVVVQLQFSIEEGLVPKQDYKPWVSALEDGNAVMGPMFSACHDCEVLMMVGLPASGKTTWAEKWMKEHPEKRYVLLGTNLALDQMKVPGLLRKQNYGVRFDCLMDRATGIFNTLLSMAASTNRNYIIDQTNVYKSARKRKMRSFANFQKIAVVLFTKPEELKIRSQKRFKEMGKEVPEDAVNEMLANFVLPSSKDMPGSDECFDAVMFPELNRDDAQKYLYEMKRNLDYAAKSNSKVTGGHSHISQSPLPLNQAYNGPSQVHPTFQGAGVHGWTESPGAYQQYQSSLSPTDRTYYGDGGRTCYNFGSSSYNFDCGENYSVPGVASIPDCRSYGGPYRRPNYDMTIHCATPPGSARPSHGTPPAIGGYNHPPIPTSMPHSGGYTLPLRPTGMLQSRYVLPHSPLSTGMLSSNYIIPATPPPSLPTGMSHAQYGVTPRAPPQTGVPHYGEAYVTRPNYY